MQRKNIPALYHEKQYRNYCRCHALHNLIGKRLMTYTEFDNLCDTFDRTHNYDVGVSRRNYYFLNNGGIDNIFGFILREKGYQFNMKHYDYYRKKQIVIHPKSIGLILYSHSHTYCARMVNGVLYKIDSLGRTIQKVNPSLFQRPGVGVIDVFRS